MAADIAALVSSYLDDKSSTNSYISTLLESVAERQSLQGSGCSKEWIAKLNSLLNTNSDRWLGISLLGTTLQQCDTKVFTANCMSWMKTVQQILEFPISSLSLIQCSVKVLDDLMRYTIQFPDLMRNLANSTVPSIISALLSLTDRDIICSLRGICTCLTYFPGPASTFKSQIEKCVTSYLDTSNADIRKHCAQCFALIAGYGSNVSDDKQRKNWNIQWSRILGTIHAILDNLHAYDDIKVNNETNEMLPVGVIANEEPKKTNTCTARLRSLIQYLEAMIREGTRKVSMVPVEDTITLLERLLAVNDNMLRQSVSLDVVLLKSCLPLIHLSAVELLCSLIQRCGSLLLPDAGRIASMLVKELSWTSDIQSSQHGSFKPYSKLRCAVYNCFVHWGHLNASCHPNIIKDVILNILKEIKVSSNNQTKLKAPLTDLKQHKSKGKKRKLQEMEQLSTNHKKTDPLDNAIICHTALSALFGVLINCGDYMAKEIFQEVQMTLLDLVNQFQSSSPGTLPQPYGSADCRKEVYHCLHACILARPSGAPSAINCVIRCFKQGLQDTHFKVSSYCREALTVVTALIHPVVPSLDIAVQPMIYSNQTIPGTSHSNHNGQLEDTNSLYSKENESSFPGMSIDAPDVQSSCENSSHNEKHTKTEEKSHTIAAGQSTEQSTSNALNKDTRNCMSAASLESEEDCQFIHKTSDSDLPIPEFQPTDINTNENSSSGNTNVSGCSFSEKQSESLKTVQPSVCDDQDIRTVPIKKSLKTVQPSVCDDQDIPTVPVKKHKPDGYECDTVDGNGGSGLELADVASNNNKQDTNDTQDIDDVNEMLASFVNSSPDSESDG